MIVGRLGGNHFPCYMGGRRFAPYVVQTCEHLRRYSASKRTARGQQPFLLTELGHKGFAQNLDFVLPRLGIPSDEIVGGAERGGCARVDCSSRQHRRRHQSDRMTFIGIFNNPMEEEDKSERVPVGCLGRAVQMPMPTCRPSFPPRCPGTDSRHTAR